MLATEPLKRPNDHMHNTNNGPIQLDSEGHSARYVQILPSAAAIQLVRFPSNFYNPSVRFLQFFIFTFADQPSVELAGYSEEQIPPATSSVKPMPTV